MSFHSIALAPAESSSECGKFEIPFRLLLGPGPSNTFNEVLDVMRNPALGYMDPVFLGILDDVQNLLRYAFQTKNLETYAVSGTGSSAMETAVANLIEPGDSMLVFEAGLFAQRISEMGRRHGAKVDTVSRPWGTAFLLNEISEKIRSMKPKVVAIVHVETSTGVIQHLEGIGEICREVGALFLVDSVTGLGTTTLLVDEWMIDVCYSCSQKGLGCPSGISPITFGHRAVEKMKFRKTPMPVWSLDLLLIRKYWTNGEKGRVYHHTPSAQLIYGLRESLCLLAKEGLENVWERHAEAAKYLYKKMEENGLKVFVASAEHRAPALTTVCIPESIDGTVVIGNLLSKHNIEIGSGIGPLAGKVWRIGLMGANAHKDNVEKLFFAITNEL